MSTKPKPIHIITSFPLRKRWWPKGFLATVVIFNTVILSYSASGKNLLVPLGALFILGIALHSFIFPTRYELHQDYIIKYQLGLGIKIELNKFNGFRIFSEGVLLISEQKKKVEHLWVFDERDRTVLSEFFKRRYP